MARRKRPAGQTRRAGSSFELAELPQDLGINVRREDMMYVLTTFLESADDVKAMAAKAPLYRALLERVLPDTEYTRRRLARLLEGLEELSRALRVLLTLDDLDLFGEAKNLISTGLRDIEASARSGATSPGKIANKRFEQGVSQLVERLRSYPDPRVRNALTVLSQSGRILDLSRPLPPLPSTASIPLSDFSWKRVDAPKRRTRTNHR